MKTGYSPFRGGLRRDLTPSRLRSAATNLGAKFLAGFPPRLGIIQLIAKLKAGKKRVYKSSDGRITGQQDCGP